MRGVAGILGASDHKGSDTRYAQVLFDKFAARFDDTLESIHYEIPRKIAGLLALPAMGESHHLDILDAGCGTGLAIPSLRPVARRLVGVDVSQKMMDVARAKGGYDELILGDAVDYMSRHPESFDLVVAADVIIYIGRIEPLLAAARIALRSGGAIALSAESLPPDLDNGSYVLRPSGRYQHSPRYLSQAVAAAGLQMEMCSPSVIRVEYGKPLDGWIIVARKN